MNFKLLFIMICIDKYIEVQSKYVNSNCDSLYLSELQDFMYDFLLEFNSNKLKKFSDFGNSLLCRSLCTRYYSDCSKFCNLFNKKIRMLKFRSF